jgi:hypothetical protein
VAALISYPRSHQARRRGVFANPKSVSVAVATASSSARVVRISGADDSARPEQATATGARASPGASVPKVARCRLPHWDRDALPLPCYCGPGGEWPFRVAALTSTRRGSASAGPCPSRSSNGSGGPARRSRATTWASGSSVDIGRRSSSLFAEYA